VDKHTIDMQRITIDRAIDNAQAALRWHAAAAEQTANRIATLTLAKANLTVDTDGCDCPA